MTYFVYIIFHVIKQILKSEKNKETIFQLFKEQYPEYFLGIIDYKKYGHFVGIGTKDYQYIIDDPAGLMAAARRRAKARALTSTSW